MKVKLEKLSFIILALVLLLSLCLNAYFFINNGKNFIKEKTGKEDGTESSIEASKGIWEIFNYDNKAYIVLIGSKPCGGCSWLENLVIYDPITGTSETRELDFNFETAEFSPDKTKVIHTDNSSVYIYDIISGENVITSKVPDGGSVIAAECVENVIIPDYKWVNEDYSGKFDAQITVRNKNGKIVMNEDNSCGYNEGKILETIIVKKEDIWR